MSQAILSQFAATTNKQPAVLASVVEVTDASPAKAGAKIILVENVTTPGTVGGSKLEAAILNNARVVLEYWIPKKVHYRLTE